MSDLRLFDVPPDWAEHWKDMPEFVQGDERPTSSIRVHFKTDEDRREFLERVGVPPDGAGWLPGLRRTGIWYPYRAPRRYRAPDVFKKVRSGRYPIYVISKGRWERRLTSIALEELGLSYRIVVEPQELGSYSENIDESRILVLPFSNLGQGSIPARNWVWDHAVESGAERHWILDDNIFNFARVNHNETRKIWDENPFIPCEEFVDRYENVALAGMQYRGFASDQNPNLPPFRLNTRVYSCILINHELPFRWRGRYNEDTDLSLRALKAGWVTVLFNAYLCHKEVTMRMAGGNTDELYAGNGRLKMAESLRDQHPDCVTITEKWGRPQHHVDYSLFTQQLVAK